MTMRAARIALDHELATIMRRHSSHGVLLQLLARSGKVAITKIQVDQHLQGHGLARSVLLDLCAWADRKGHALGVTPSATWGADPARLTAFYESLGFGPNTEANNPLRAHDTMVRYPAREVNHATASVHDA